MARGKGRLRIDDREVPVGPGSILYVRATAAHSFFEIEEDMTLLVFFASGGCLRAGGLTPASGVRISALSNDDLSSNNHSRRARRGLQCVAGLLSRRGWGSKYLEP